MNNTIMQLPNGDFEVLPLRACGCCGAGQDAEALKCVACGALFDNVPVLTNNPRFQQVFPAIR